MQIEQAPIKSVESVKRTAWFLATAAFAVVLLSRLLHISAFTVNLPWADSWDGEVESLYYAYLDGTLGWQGLWAQANEHRIVLTRLLNLSIFALAGEFNQITTSMAQSVIFCAAVALIVFNLNREETRWWRTAAVAVMFLPVLDWENAYWGYQSQVYFAIFFAVLAIHMIASGVTNPVIFIALTALAGFSNSAACYIPMLAVGGIILDRDYSPKKLASIAIYALAAYVAYRVFSAPTPWHDQYKAHDLATLWASTIKYLSWPREAGIVLSFSAVALGAAVAFNTVFGKRPISASSKFMVLLVCWFTLFLASSIYMRAGFDWIPERYYPYYVVGISGLFFAPVAINRVAALIAAPALLAILIVETNVSLAASGAYAQMQRAYADNIIRAKDAPDPASALAIMQELPLPYAGHPDINVPHRVITNPHFRTIYHREPTPVE